VTSSLNPEGANGSPQPEAKGWYSRGYLPHMDQPGLVQFIDFRLYDAVPAPIVEQWKEELRWREGMRSDEPAVAALSRKISQFEDAGRGHCWLADERVAALVEDALLFFDSVRYRLLAWCVMPNHVHVLCEMQEQYPLSHVVHSWKSFTAQRANPLLGRSGTFWAREYYDRFVRDDAHLRRAMAYIEGNPARAGLVETPESWRFGSARRRAEGRGPGTEG
jgi:REP element-mobilizing transposase RayT